MYNYVYLPLIMDCVTIPGNSVQMYEGTFDFFFHRKWTTKERKFKRRSSSKEKPGTPQSVKEEVSVL